MLKELTRYVKVRLNYRVSKPVDVVIGVLKPNIHETGIYTAELLLITHGIKVLNLGVNISPEVFARTCIEYEPKVLVIAVYSDHGKYGEKTEPYLTRTVELLRKFRSRIEIHFTGYAAHEIFAEKLKEYTLLNNYLELLDIIVRRNSIS